MVSTLHMGLISSQDWLCELLFIQAHVLCENDETFSLFFRTNFASYIFVGGLVGRVFKWLLN